MKKDQIVVRKTASDISSNFCIMPWAGLATSPTGGLRPCCWVKPEESFFGTADEYSHSQYLKDMKTDFLNGVYPPACAQCKWNDDNGLKSMRIVENQNWELMSNSWENYDVGFSMFDFRLSNICNLGCVTCNPGSSSFIHREIKTLYRYTPKHWTKDTVLSEPKSVYTPYSEEEVDRFVSLISPNSSIYCTGGEPSIDKRIHRLLDALIKKGLNETIFLRFNSNFQSLNKDFISMLKRFSGSMAPSIDGVGKSAEYIRYPCNWDQVDANIRYFVEECSATWTMNLRPTVSILSIFGIDDLIEWTNLLKKQCGAEDKTKITFGNRLVTPGYFDIRNLPDKAKDHVVDNCLRIIKNHPETNRRGDIDDVISHVRQPPNHLFKSTLIALSRIDRMRNTDWKLSLPELHKWQ